MLRTDEKIESYLEQGHWTNEVITDQLDAVAAATPDKIAAIDPRGELSYGELKRLQRPGRAGPAGAGRAARRRGQLPATELDRVPGRALRGDPDRRREQPADPDLPRPRGRLHGRAGPVQGDHRAAGVPRLRPPGHGRPAARELARPAARAGRGRPLLAGVHRHPVGAAARPGRAGRAAPGPERRHAADLHLGHDRGAEGRDAHAQHADRGERPAAGPARRRPGQRDPHGLDVRAPHRVPLRRPAAHPGRRRDRGLPGRVARTDVRRPGRAAPDQLHLGGHPVPGDTLSVPDLGERDLSSLQRFCCMGAPIPRAVVRDAKRKLPGLAVLGGWGQTEDALVTLGIPGDPEEKIVERDGYPWPGHAHPGGRRRRQPLPRRAGGGAAGHRPVPVRRLLGAPGA